MKQANLWDMFKKKDDKVPSPSAS
jgi:hypothetical protein